MELNPIAITILKNGKNKEFEQGSANFSRAIRNIFDFENIFCI